MDEASKKRKDAWRRRGHGQRGARLQVRVRFQQAGNAASIVLAVSILGIEMAEFVDVNADGNIGTFRIKSLESF